MIKRFLLPTLAVGVLTGSAIAEDPSTATAWICTSQTSRRAEYDIKGNELKKRDDGLDRYEACRRDHPAPTPGPEGKIGAETFPTDPCEPPDLESYTFKIELNNPEILIAVSPAAQGDTWIAKRMMVLDKLTGNYTETLLSTPTLQHHIAGNERGGTCDVMSHGKPTSVSNLPDVSRNPVRVVKEAKKPPKESETHENHVHARQHHRYHRHVHRRHKLLTESRRR